MKIFRLGFVVLVLAVVLVGAACAGGSWSVNYEYRTTANISMNETPSVNVLWVHKGVGTNNASDVYLNNHAQADLEDLRFIQASQELNYWIVNNTTDPAKIYIEVPSTGEISLYYGNTGATRASNGYTTFSYYSSFEKTTDLNGWSNTVSRTTTDNPTHGNYTGYVQMDDGTLRADKTINTSEYIEYDFKVGDNPSTSYAGVAGDINIVYIGLRGFYNGTAWDNTNFTPNNNEWYHITLACDNGTLYAYVNDTLIGTTPNNNMTQFRIGVSDSSTVDSPANDRTFVDKIRAQPTYETPHPNWTTWTSESTRSTVSIKARDSNTGEYLVSFNTTLAGITHSTDNGTITYKVHPDVENTLRITSTGYYELVTTMSITQTTTKVYTLSKYASDYYAPHYVTFTVCGLLGKTYQNVRVKVYKGGFTDEISTTAGPLFNTTTDNQGSVTFQLNPNIRYLIQFTSDDINRSIELYPEDTEYKIIVGGTSITGWWEYEEATRDVINTTVGTNVVDGTTAEINVTYNDTLNQTTHTQVWVNQTNPTDPVNQTIIDTYNISNSSVWEYTFTVTDYQGESYIVHITSNHDTRGRIDRSYAVRFTGPRVWQGLPSYAYTWISAALLVFTGAVFTQTTIPRGSLILCGTAWILYYWRWLDHPGVGAALGLATLISVIAVIREGEREVYE